MVQILCGTEPIDHLKRVRNRELNARTSKDSKLIPFGGKGLGDKSLGALEPW
jgi:hypothetical protein